MNPHHIFFEAGGAPRHARGTYPAMRGMVGGNIPEAGISINPGYPGLAKEDKPAGLARIEERHIMQKVNRFRAPNAEKSRITPSQGMRRLAPAPGAWLFLGYADVL